MILHVKGWDEFQHYKGRRPPWIKLHRALLDDYNWHRLPDASKALAPMLWLLASESEDGSIDLPEEEIAFRLRATVDHIRAALKPLISAGFFNVEHVASAPLAECERHACSETETETETEERESGASAPKPTKRASRIPDDWAVSEQGKVFANGLGLDPLKVAEAFKDYWQAATGSTSRKLDWDAAYRTWCRRQADQPTRKASTFRAEPEQRSTQPLAEPWEQRLSGWRKSGWWLPMVWGPKPGEPGCRVPSSMISQG